MRPVDFQQHSQKNQRAISVSCPETAFAKTNFCRKFFQQKILDPVLFHNVSAQNPPAGRHTATQMQENLLSLVIRSRVQHICLNTRTALTAGNGGHFQFQVNNTLYPNWTSEHRRTEGIVRAQRA
jgi:hypothetical protein